MFNEKLIEDVKAEAYSVAVETGSRSAVSLVLELYPEQAENILMQVSARLEFSGYSRRAELMEKLTKEI